MYDPSSMFVEQENLKKELNIPHRGFYIGVVNSTDEEVSRVGFMQEGLTNIRDSATIVCKNLYDELVSKNVVVDRIKTSTFFFSVVWDCIYLPDPLIWNESTDGVYFMWGQRYKGLYLPYQINRMKMSKIDILDRLCSFEAKVPSSLWRLPEGLVFRVLCDSFTA